MLTSRRMDRRSLLTGCGAVSPLGIGVPAFWRGLLDQGKSPNIEAALVKDVGTAFEREIPEVARRLVAAEPSLDAHDDVFVETLGHVVLGCDAHSLDWSRSHERVHVAQYERWGPFFLPVYAAASAWAVMTGRHFYRDNAFEVEAFGVGQGNPEGLPPREAQDGGSPLRDEPIASTGR